MIRLNSIMVELGEEFDLPEGSFIITATVMPSGARWMVIYAEPA